jgi:hypothetical protein
MVAGSSGAPEPDSTKLLSGTEGNCCGAVLAAAAQRADFISARRETVGAYEFF